MAAYADYTLTERLYQSWQGPGSLAVVNRDSVATITVTIVSAGGNTEVATLSAGDRMSADLTGAEAITIEASAYPATIALLLSPLAGLTFGPMQSVVVENALDVTVVNVPSVNVANTPSVNVANSPTVQIGAANSVQVANTPSVNVANAPNVNVANTPTVNIGGANTVNVAGQTVNVQNPTASDVLNAAGVTRYLGTLTTDGVNDTTLVVTLQPNDSAIVVVPLTGSVTDANCRATVTGNQSGANYGIRYVEMGAQSMTFPVAKGGDTTVTVAVHSYGVARSFMIFADSTMPIVVVERATMRGRSSDQAAWNIANAAPGTTVIQNFNIGPHYWINRLAFTFNVRGTTIAAQIARGVLYITGSSSGSYGLAYFIASSGAPYNEHIEFNNPLSPEGSLSGTTWTLQLSVTALAGTVAYDCSGYIDFLTEG